MSFNLSNWVYWQSGQQCYALKMTATPLVLWDKLTLYNQLDELGYFAEHDQGSHKGL